MSIENSTIRLATHDDVAAITDLTAAAYRKYIPRIGRKPKPMTADYALLLQRDLIWIVEVEDHIAGVLVLQSEADALLIYSIAIHPNDQKRGLGRVLLEWAEQQALHAGYQALRLYTNALMSENIVLYTRIGYQETRRESYLGGEIVHMCKHLKYRLTPAVI